MRVRLQGLSRRLDGSPTPNPNPSRSPYPASWYPPVTPLVYGGPPLLWSVADGQRSYFNFTAPGNGSFTASLQFWPSSLIGQDGSVSFFLGVQPPVLNYFYNDAAAPTSAVASGQLDVSASIAMSVHTVTCIWRYTSWLQIFVMPSDSFFQGAGGMYYLKVSRVILVFRHFEIHPLQARGIEGTTFLISVQDGKAAASPLAAPPASNVIPSQVGPLLTHASALCL